MNKSLLLDKVIESSGFAPQLRLRLLAEKDLESGRGTPKIVVLLVV